MLIYQEQELGRAKGKVEQTDTQVLHKWLRAAAKAESIEEFERSVCLVNLEE